MYGSNLRFHHLTILVHSLRVDSVYPALQTPVSLTRALSPLAGTYLVKEDEENNVVPETGQSMQHRHLYAEPGPSRQLNTRTQLVWTYAKRSSTTVDNDLYIIAFSGMWATLCATPYVMHSVAQD